MTIAGANARQHTQPRSTDELIERDGRLVDVAGALVDELHSALAAGDAALRDVEAGPACSVSLRDALVLAWVRGRAVVVQLEDDPRPAAPVPPVDPAVVY